MEWGEARGRRQEEKGAVALLTLAALISGRRQWRMHFEGDNLTDARCYWPVALGHAHIALEKGASCQATGYPFNGYHLAFASNESLSAALFHISSANTLKREKERERREERERNCKRTVDYTQRKPVERYRHSDTLYPVLEDLYNSTTASDRIEICGIRRFSIDQNVCMFKQYTAT